MPLATMEIYLYEQVSVRAGTITREFRREMHARCSRSSRKYTFRPTLKKKTGRTLFVQSVMDHPHLSLSPLLPYNQIEINFS